MSLLIYLYITTQLFILPYRAVAAYASPQTSFQRQGHPELVLDDEFTAWLERTGHEWGMKGVAIAVTRRLKDEKGDWVGWTSETKGYGIADRWGTPVDADTLFSIASNSKLFTAIGIGLLTENKTLPMTWETKIQDILPENQWKLQDPTAQNQANLVDILSHRTGLPRHDLSYSRTDNLATVISNLRYLKPSAEFRDTFQYNNQMYFLATQIIQHVTGISFSQFITENVISPLGLDSTTYNLTEAEVSGHLADGFVGTGMDENMGEGKRKLVFKPVPFETTEDEVELNAGPGGVISSANDLMTWLQTLLLNGRHPITNAAIIPESIISRAAYGITCPTPLPSWPELSPKVYGMGQSIYSYQGRNLIEHTGGTIGYSSLITRAPNDGVGVAILTNTLRDDPFVDLVKYRLLEKALGLDQIDWSSRYSAEENLQRDAVDNPTRSDIQEKKPSSLPVRGLAGVYFNPAYGTINLCDFHSYVTSPETSPTGCKKTVEDIAEILHGPPPALVASWHKFWSTHLLLYHEDKDQFDISLIFTFPPPFPNTPKSENGSHPFAIESGQGSANFVFTREVGAESQRVDGIAIAGVWGSGSGVQTLAGRDRESAEVWFDRVV
ncbi:beta-lactamase/transpeptidase-like protein [Hysterangium stoloniferum]|nr:beta-lactamase/transpeptidase-like protein [Hysterangium stoloniferum]